jgi:PKD repeat protein
MNPAQRTSARKAVHAVLLFATFLSLGASAASAQTRPAPTLEILGSSSLGEDITRQWAVVLRNPPLASSDSAYAPPQAGTFLDYEPTVEYRWDFGDGTGIVSTGERVSASHTYADDGSFVLSVEAWAEGRSVARAEKAIEVRNRNPVDVLIAAVEIDPSRSLYELSATAVDAADDELTYSWNFGDGSSGEGPRVEHAYPIAGTYPVTLTVTDDDGGSAEKILQLVVIGAGEAGESSVDPLTGDATVTGVATSFEAAIRGGLTADVRGRILPVAGIHLAPVEGGRRCRFMFTVADPSQLAMIIMILDLASLPPEGARYRVPFRGSVNFYPDRARYERSIRGAGQTVESFGILDRIVPDDPGHVPSSAETSDGEIAAATSPFGISDHVGFMPASGTVELTFVPRDRAVGTFDLGLTNPNRNRDQYPEIAMSGSFAVDLGAAAREGLMLYAKCGGGALEIDKMIPADGEQHSNASRLGATFSDDVDPATLNAETVQLTYPAADTETPVVVASRILRRPRAVILQPEKPLFPGVRYTARVKTGPKGVRGKNGVALTDDDGSGWRRWTFTTKLDLEPGAGNLACHVFQTVRDAPLIAGKPAVARIYADWKLHPEVHESAQVKEFSAKVILESGADAIASEVYRFVRPNLWKPRGIDKAEAEHTANLYWTPDKSSPSFLRVALEVESAPGRVHEKRYFTRCATPLWPHQPVLRVEFYMLQANAWRDAAVFDAAMPRVQRIIGAAQILMQQVFPFHKVETRFLGPLSRDGREVCDQLCLRNLLARREGTSDADVLVAFESVAPGEEPSGGEFQKLNSDDGPQGLVFFSIDDNPAHDDRFVFGVAHEVGHTLWLEHMPTVTDESRATLLEMRNEALNAPGREPKHLYPGIEGFRIVPGGGDGWNKSSSEGNGEESWLVPLMYPGSVPYRDAFIMRHQYLAIQAFLERGNGNPQSGTPPRP